MYRVYSSCVIFFFKQKTAYEMRISDWSSDVCSSDLYQGITVNIGNGDRAKNPLGEDARLRQAFELAIDRAALNQVVFEGAFAPGNQPFPPNSPWYDSEVPIPARDIEKAKALMQEAGHETFDVEVQVANNPVQTQIMQVVQRSEEHTSELQSLMRISYA